MLQAFKHNIYTCYCLNGRKFNKRALHVDTWCGYIRACCIRSV